MLTLSGLTKRFKSVAAVSDVSFDVSPGEIFGLLGANGAGKTTTLRMLATMLSPTAGTANIDGSDIIKSPDEVRAKTGLLFGGDMGLYDRLTARENIVYFARLSDMDAAQAAERTELLAQAFNFAEYLDFPAKKLSKGTRQKVALARSVVHNPSVMLFDEPMVGLDVTSRRDVEEFIFSLRRQSRTIILSDHNLDVITRLCDRVGILHRGQLLACGTAGELCAAHGCKSLEDVFFGLAGKESAST